MSTVTVTEEEAKRILNDRKFVAMGYRYDSLLNGGSTWTVFKVYNSYEQRSVAMKIAPVTDDDWLCKAIKASHSISAINAQTKSEADELGRVERNLLQKDALMNNPHVVRIMGIEDYEEAFENTGVLRRYVIVFMELLHTFTIEPQKQQAQENVVKLGLDISDALIACAKEKITHRDIKPDNILQDDNGNYKLIDFGEARMVDRELGLTARGTPLYTAPEVKFGHERDSDFTLAAKADIYSLGLVMYQMANRGFLPFMPMNRAILSAVDETNGYQKRIEGKCPLPMPEGINASLWRVIQKACAFNADDRYSNAADMNRDLQKIQDEKSPENSEEIPSPFDQTVNLDRTFKVNSGFPNNPVPDQKEEKKKKTSALVYIIPIVTVLAIAGVLFFLNKPDDSVHIHNMKIVSQGLLPSCTNAGYGRYYACDSDDCGLYFDDSQALIGDSQALNVWKNEGGAGYLAPTGHTAGSWETTQEATVEKKGKEVQKCSICGAVLNSRSIPELDNVEFLLNKPDDSVHIHNMKIVSSGLSPSCTNAGYGRYYVCDSDDCGLYFDDSQVLIGDSQALKAWKNEGGAGYLAPTGHTAGPWETTQIATVEKKGREVQKCSICGTVLNSRSIPELDNAEKQQGPKWTCLSCKHINEYDSIFCENCGKSVNSWECKQCRAINSPNNAFCENCGKSVNSWKCKQCQAVNSPDNAFCEECGTKHE